MLMLGSYIYEKEAGTDVKIRVSCNYILIDSKIG